MTRINKSKHFRARRGHRLEPTAGKLRIIGGHFKGRQIQYSGDPTTRPMKDNIREATFNLVGGWIPGKHVFDLFAGTGALGLEALSRGAVHATLIERHIPTARIIRNNVTALDVEDSTTVITSNTFFWFRQFIKASASWPKSAWAVFCSPPYDLYVDSKEQILGMVAGLIEASPAESIFAIESDERFNSANLPQAVQWKVRNYSPAQICILRK